MDRVIIGVDPHKLSVTIEARDTREVLRATGRFGTDTRSYHQLLKVARQWPQRRRHRFFVTFLDNHGTEERARDRQPDGSHPYDQQLFLRFAALVTLPGVPCLYYGTERGLDGRGTDQAVREALWGGPGFDPASTFYTQIQKLMAVRATQPPLRYGRYYFRPVSTDGFSFSVPANAGGILAYSRILANQEVIVAANTSTTTPATAAVIVDQTLTPDGTALAIAYSNHPAAQTPAPVQHIVSASVAEVDGSHGTGPLNAVTAILAPMEIQILAR